MNGQRLRGLSFGFLLLGGVGAIAVSAQSWWQVETDVTGIAFSGTDATAGLSQSLAIVMLAGTLLALALKITGRRVLGGMLILVGIGAAITGLVRPQPSATSVQTKLQTVTLTDQFALSGTAWPWFYAAAGLIAILGAAVMMITAQRWPSRADRFDRSSNQPVVAPAEGDGSEDPTLLWKAMDAGVDPTDESASPPPGVQGPTAPISVEDRSGDTMRGPDVSGPRERG